MALQELCGLPGSARSLSRGLPQNDASLLPRDEARSSSSDTWTWRPTNPPLSFYIPVADYLEESPLHFGQIRSSPPPGSSTTPDSILSALSLPLSLPPFSSSPSVPLPFPLSHGTTTLAFLFQGGVIAAADTRSSCSGLVACPASQKILPVHSHLVGTTSGTSADCALWKRILSRELRLYQLRHGRRLSTGGAAKLLAHMLHPFKGTELCVAATLCGWDGGEVEACPLHEAEAVEAGGEAVQEAGGEAAEAGAEAGREAVSEAVETGPEVVEAGGEEVSEAVEAGLEADRETSPEPGSDNSKSDHKRPRTSLPSTPVAWRKSQCLRPSTRGRQCTAGGRQGFSGPSLYYVCSDGTRLQGELFSVGSGSPYAYSVLDGQVRWGLSVGEAVVVAREAVFRATHRDAYSGNCVDLYHVTAQGWTRRQREELKEEYYREKEERERERERGG
ncbi:proteasome subunit beta type-11-like, partial [Osmerus eperlanus]|uniref:proteasome subunit beta type-11-like n=1 Tax=Osmerus eperlanus TaxID=29151 RepID=UPI002E146CF0